LNQLFWQKQQHPLQDKKLKIVHKSPNVFVMDDFLTHSELSYCATLFDDDKRFSKSFLDTSDNQTIYQQDQRTSSFCSLTKLQNAHVASIERRASDFLGVSVEQLEPLQLVRYRVGEFFGIHHDLGILYDDGSVELPRRHSLQKRRIATIFVYLNDSDGCTYFPCCRELRITPKRGRAVFFCNILQNGMPDPNTIHAGEAPTVGIKYGLNIWVCET
jgi:prolyl 4-hydroxylase